MNNGNPMTPQIRLAFVPISRTKDLTGKIRILDQYAFAQGGQADVYKGKWNQCSGKTITVPPSNNLDDSNVNTSWTIQVALKVIRSNAVNSDDFARLKLVSCLHFTAASGVTYGRRRNCFEREKSGLG